MQGIWKFKSKLASNTLISLMLYSVSICTTSVQLTDVLDEVYFRRIFFSNGHILTTEGSSDRPSVWNPKIWSEVERKRYFVSLAATFTFYLAKWMYDFLSSWMVLEMPKSRWVRYHWSLFDNYSEILHRKDIFKRSLFTVPLLFSMHSLYLHRSRILQFRYHRRCRYMESCKTDEILWRRVVEHFHVRTEWDYCNFHRLD